MIGFAQQVRLDLVEVETETAVGARGDDRAGLLVDDPERSEVRGPGVTATGLFEDQALSASRSAEPILSDLVVFGHALNVAPVTLEDKPRIQLEGARGAHWDCPVRREAMDSNSVRVRSADITR